MILQKNYLLMLGVVLLMALSLRYMVHNAYILPQFYQDEIPNNQSAVSFLSNGNYKNDRYGMVYSSGVAVSWPGAIGWIVGKNLLSARIACSVASWLLGLFVGYLFFIKLKYTRLQALAISVCIWAFSITSPFAMPYWFGFIYNLGELNTMLIIALSLLIFSKRPFWMAFMFGLVVWHGKLLSSVMVIALLFGHLLSQKLKIADFMFSALKYILALILPLLIWLAWISLKLGLETTKEWFLVYTGWLKDMNTLHAPSEYTFSWKGLIFRFYDPKLEWVGYSLGNKIKNIFFSLGAVTFTLFSLRMFKIKKIKMTEREYWLSIMACLSILFYSVVSFFVESHMWQRYHQPAIYTGLGLFLFWGFKWIQQYSIVIKKPLYACILFLIFLQCVYSLKNYVNEPAESYARSCSNLYAAECDPDFYK